MGVDDYRDREGDAEERTGPGEGVGADERDAGVGVRDDRNAEGDAEQRTWLGSDPGGVDAGFSDAVTEGDDTSSG
jgi:hypothetical protein